jgi:hypothetical protein
MRGWIDRIHSDPEFAMGLGSAAAEMIHREANFSKVWQRLLEGLQGRMRK